MESSRIASWLLRLAVILFSCASLAVTADKLPLEQILVDFDQPQTHPMVSNHAQAELIKKAGGQALQITTEPTAQFPSVRIEPQNGPWDLTGYDAVTVEVQNPEEVPLRVLLSVNNPGADGRNKCNVASIRLAGGESGLLVVPFGVWHGEPGHTLDLAKIVSLEVLLDRPGQGHRFTVDNFRAMRNERFDLQEAMANSYFRQLRPPFGRGVNLGNALEAPQEGKWGVKLEEDYFSAIKAAGFDSIRLPVCWSAHADSKPPYRIDPQFFERVDWAVRQALSRQLKLVLNVHHYAEMDQRPDEHRARFLALWEQIAEHYRDRPAELAFELLNEPHDNLTAPKWNKLLAEAIAIVRKTNPTRTIVVGPVAWNGISELKSLVLPEADRNLVVTVHYYSPFSFTHQGAKWVDPKSRQPVGTKWLGTADEKQAVVRDLDKAIIWGLKHQRPIYLGEFGALDKADLESRVRWTRFIADEAAKRKIGTGYWEFCAGFGAFDPAKKVWIEPLRDAILSASR